jgi:hypothetical protein
MFKGSGYVKRYNDGLQAERPWLGCRQGKEIFVFSTASSTDLVPTQPPIQWVLKVLSLGVKRPRHKADHSPPSNSEFKNDGAIPPLPHMYSWYTA